MGSESRRRVVTALAAVAEDAVEPKLCSICASLVGVSGAAVVVVGKGAHRAVLCSSNATAALLEDLQTTLGEGPGVDAYRLGVPVAEADLARSARSRWLAFAEPALDAGAAAVFAFPSGWAASVWAPSPSTTSAPDVSPTTATPTPGAVADVVTHVVLALQVQAPPGMVARALASAADDGSEVYQASGMLAVRLGVTVGEAKVRLRALAYSEGRPLADVAQDVIARRPGRR